MDNPNRRCPYGKDRIKNPQKEDFPDASVCADADADSGAGHDGAAFPDSPGPDLRHHRRGSGGDLHHLCHGPGGGSGTGGSNLKRRRYLHHPGGGGRGIHYGQARPENTSPIPWADHGGDHIRRDGRGAADPPESGGVRRGRGLPWIGGRDLRRNGIAR